MDPITKSNKAAYAHARTKGAETARAMSALVALARGCSSARQVADALDLPTRQASRVLNTLKSDGYARNTPDHTPRCVVWAPTKAGRLLAASHEAHRGLVEQATPRPLVDLLLALPRMPKRVSKRSTSFVSKGVITERPVADRWGAARELERDRRFAASTHPDILQEVPWVTAEAIAHANNNPAVPASEIASDAVAARLKYDKGTHLPFTHDPSAVPVPRIDPGAGYGQPGSANWPKAPDPSACPDLNPHSSFCHDPGCPAHGTST